MREYLGYFEPKRAGYYENYHRIMSLNEIRTYLLPYKKAIFLTGCVIALAIGFNIQGIINYFF
jgi:hypothetical protein